MGNMKAEMITGRRPTMVPHGLRIIEDESKILRKTAKIKKSNESDLLRTAWHEFIENHNLREMIAEAKAKAKRPKAK